MAGQWERAIAKFKDRSARVGILGLGYAGLPLTCCFAEAGFETFGFDVDQVKIEQLRAGRSYIGHIPAARIAALIKTGRLRPSADFAPLSACDAAGQDSRHLCFRRGAFGIKASCDLPLALPKLLVAEPFSEPDDKPLLPDPK